MATFDVLSLFSFDSAFGNFGYKVDREVSETGKIL